MSIFKLISFASNPRLVQHYLFCQYLLRHFLEKEVSEQSLQPGLFEKWHNRLEWALAQLSDEDKEIIDEIYK